jgi:hypothetical protein
VDSQRLRAAQQPLKGRLWQNPDQALVTLSAQGELGANPVPTDATLTTLLGEAVQ